MKVIGFLLTFVGFGAMEHGGGITWGQIAMIVAGTLMMFPKLIGYAKKNVKK